MNWNNLKENKCPECSGKLNFRLKGKEFKIKANKGSSRSQDDDWLFCSKKGCKGFQISLKRFKQIVSEIECNEFKEFKNNPLFKDGLLSL